MQQEIESIALLKANRQQDSQDSEHTSWRGLPVTGKRLDGLTTEQKLGEQEQLSHRFVDRRTDDCPSNDRAQPFQDANMEHRAHQHQPNDQAILQTINELKECLSQMRKDSSAIQLEIKQERALREKEVRESQHL